MEQFVGALRYNLYGSGVLICTVVVLYCFVMCVCVSVCVCVCVL